MDSDRGRGRIAGCSRRELLVSTGVAAASALAGCTDGSGPAGGGESASGDGSGATDGGGSATGGQADGSSDEWRLFAFERPGRYEYAYAYENGDSGSLVLDVSAVEDESVTVGLLHEAGDDSFETTVSGDRETVERELLSTPAGPVLALAIFSPMLSGFRREELETGLEWTAQSPEGSARYAVEGTATQGGLECYETAVEVDGEVVHEGCINPDHGVALRSVFYDEGAPVFELELVSYTPA